MITGLFRSATRGASILATWRTNSKACGDSAARGDGEGDRRVEGKRHVHARGVATVRAAERDAIPIDRDGVHRARRGQDVLHDEAHRNVPNIVQDGGNCRPQRSPRRTAVRPRERCRRQALRTPPRDSMTSNTGDRSWRTKSPHPARRAGEAHGPPEQPHVDRFRSHSYLSYSLMILGVMKINSSALLSSARHA